MCDEAYTPTESNSTAMMAFSQSHRGSQTHRYLVAVVFLCCSYVGNSFAPALAPACCQLRRPFTTNANTCGLASIANDLDLQKTSNLEPRNAAEFLSRMQTWEAQIGDDPARRNTGILAPAVDGILDDLHSILSLYDSTRDPSLRPTAEIFRTVLRVLSACREKGIDRRAQNIFLDMQEFFDIEPDPGMYESLVHVLAKAKGGAKRAESFLREALERHPGRIGIASFNVVLVAWAKSGFDYGPERAENLIALMEDMGIKPSVVSFTSLLDAYAQTNTWEGVGKAEGILNRVLALYLEGDDTFEPSIISWTIVISAWLRLSKGNNRSAGTRADRLLVRMETLFEEGKISFGPDAVVYFTCISALAHTKNKEDLIRARELLEEMQEKYLDGDDSFKPTLRSLRVLVDSWIRSKHPNRMDEAEDIVLHFQESIPELKNETLTTEEASDVRELYCSMLLGWSQVGEPGKAFEVLKEMIDKNMQVDSVCFDRVIESNTQAGGPIKRSFQVFELMEICRMEGSVTPNERIYTSFIRAMIKARVPNLASRAANILMRMEDLFKSGNIGVQPTVFTYNTVLNACAESRATNDDAANIEALKIALSAFSKIRSSKPDHMSFGNMLRCSQLVAEGPQRDSLISSTFRLCCQGGWVNDFVLSDLQLVASDEVCQAMIGVFKNDNVQIERLPASWSRVARKQRQEKELRKQDVRPESNRKDRRRL